MQLFPLSAFSSIETPFYFYDTALLQQTLDDIKAIISPEYVVHYAVKANANPRILQRIAAAGFGADCVSGGEIKAVLQVGFAADKIVFSGVGKSDREILLGLENNIHCFNVESVAELEVIDAIAAERDVVAPVALRINPHIDAHTHHYITTGLSENKFGIDITQLDSVVDLLLSMRHVQFRGLHFHIGSQVLTLEPYRLLCQTVNALQERLASKGITMDYINVGGGLGVDYEDPDAHPIPGFKDYFATFKNHLKLRPGQKLHFEVGRAIVCQCGSLITRVLYVKQGLDKQFAIVDAGMTDLIRPALYQAHHKIENISSEGILQPYDVVGPICESSDNFGTNVILPATRRGDLLALRSAGAYGEIMASQYNCRELPKSYFSDSLLLIK